MSAEAYVDTIAVLKRCEIFIGLEDSDFQKIVELASCPCRAFQAEEIIFRAGDKAEHLFVVEEGQVDLVIKGSDASPYLPGRAVVCSVSRGGVFGWPAIVPPHVFSLSAICRTPARILNISGEDLRNLFKVYPHIGLEVTNSLLRVISSRFKHIEQLLITGKRSPMFEIRKLSAE